MAFDDITQKYIPSDNQFYQNHYHHLLMALIGLIVLTILGIGVLVYEVQHRPLPTYAAIDPHNKSLVLHPAQEPNLLASTILEWSSKAAAIAYTFDFSNWRNQINAARPYFTEAGWQDYLRSVDSLINTIVQNKLLIYGVVAGAPVIANQGIIPNRGYVWRVQIPFLVTYVSASPTVTRSFMVVLSIIRVPTNVNPQGIGIDQFVMVQR